jgi:hypothetical protein
LLGGASFHSDRAPIVLANDPEDEVIVRPLDEEGSATGSFQWLEKAIDKYPTTGSVGSLAVQCNSTFCLTEFEKVGVWQGFADGFEPMRLEVGWDTIGGISLAAGRASEASFKLEYDIGNGWEPGDEDTWYSEIPPCSEAHPSRCDGNMFVKDLDPEQSTGIIQVRATVKAKMTVCGNCGTFDTSNMNVAMTVRDVRLVVQEPELIAEPGYTVTRGDTVTFRVVGAPVTSYSNWRYKFSPPVHSDIVRTENINTGSWTGPLLLPGRATVVVIVPGQSLSIPLQTEPVMTVNPRSWNSEPEDPKKVTGITPNPPGVFSTTNLNGHKGYAAWYLGGLLTGAVKLDGDTPNKGLNYVTEVKHVEDPLVHFSYEIAPDLESGTTFYSKQCGQGGFILGSVLLANAYEHESGTQKGHYQQYVDKLAEPAVNYAKHGEQRWGPVSQTLQAFESMVQAEFNDRRTTLHNAAAVQACNADVSYDPTCTFRGNINYPPYQPPCQ